MIDDALIRSANQLSRIYNPEPPLGGILYHYTNFAGLQGILESHKLRATYNKVLNDATEQVHAEAVISHELAQLGISWPKPTTQPKHFVTCFCESAKLLSMWRAYAGNCGGYCLGFEYSGLKNHMCWPDPKVGQSFHCSHRCTMGIPRSRFATTLSQLIVMGRALSIKRRCCPISSPA